MMSIEPDPKEVLLHLHELGYHNITPQQLSEFIKDLKKLIKYDITKKKLVPETQRTEDSTSSTLPNTTDGSLSPSPPPPGPRQQRSHFHPGRVQSKDLEEVSSSSSETSVAPERRVLRECTKLSAQKTQVNENVLRDKHVDASKLQPRSSKSCDCLWRRIGCKCCDENWSREQHSIKTKSKENLAPPRPKSSFIRTWQLTGQARPGSAAQRSDPVALYHQYQQAWKQQKLPGEDNHNDLRWTIRERMLGQEPHPRSCGCVCLSCPCKLTEEDFSKDPKKVSSKLLPRGPFHVDGHILGPLGLGKDGEYVIADRHLRGVFELGSESESDARNGSKKSTQPSGNSACESKKGSQIPSKSSGKRASENPSQCSDKRAFDRQRASWLSKDEVEKSSIDYKNRTDNKVVFNITDEELKVRRANHNISTCKYCSLIYKLLYSERPATNPNSTASSQNSYWPQQFTVEADVHRANDNGNSSAVSNASRPTQPSAASTPLSTKGRRDEGRTLNLAVPGERPPVQRNGEKNSDNRFETRIPITMKDFKGEVKTEIAVFKKSKTARQHPSHSSASATEPFVLVATEVRIDHL